LPPKEYSQLLPHGNLNRNTQLLRVKVKKLDRSETHVNIVLLYTCIGSMEFKILTWIWLGDPSELSPITGSTYPELKQHNRDIAK